MNTRDSVAFSKAIRKDCLRGEHTVSIETVSEVVRIMETSRFRSGVSEYGRHQAVKRPGSWLQFGLTADRGMNCSNNGNRYRKRQGTITKRATSRLLKAPFRSSEERDLSWDEGQGAAATRT